MELYLIYGISLRVCQATVDDIQEALKKISYKIQPLDIVCLWFGKDKEHGKASYWESYPGITAGVVHYLVDQGVKVIATDSLGQDHPFIKMKEKFDKTRRYRCCLGSS